MGRRIEVEARTPRALRRLTWAPLVVLLLLSPAMLALAQRPERSPEELQRIEERQRHLDVVTEAASRGVRIERARRKAPFDLHWGLR